MSSTNENDDLENLQKTTVRQVRLPVLRTISEYDHSITYSTLTILLVSRRTLI